MGEIAYLRVNRVSVVILLRSISAVEMETSFWIRNTLCLTENLVKLTRQANWITTVNNCIANNASKNSRKHLLKCDN